MSIRVLVVDDDKLARKGIISLLPWDKHDMQVAGDVQNGRAALEFLRKEPVDLVFADIDMPEMNGLELMDQCKTEFPAVRFVILSFYEEFSYAQQALRLGAVDYISKLRMEQEDGDDILERIAAVLHLQQTLVKQPEEPAAEAEEMAEEQWQEISASWKKLYWLYDDIAFAGLCGDINRLNQIPLRRMEHLIVRMIQTIETDTGRGSTRIPEFDTVSRLLIWLESWRNDLFAWAGACGSYDKMSLCILKVIQYIKNNISTTLHTEVVAETVCMSRSYFSVNFKKYTGHTFHEFVRGERIRHAKKLLTETDQSVIEISAQCGYEDVNYFNKVFLEETKNSPGEFRNRNR